MRVTAGANAALASWRLWPRLQLRILPRRCRVCVSPPRERSFNSSRTVLHPHTSHPYALLFGIARPRPSNAEACVLGGEAWLLTHTHAYVGANASWRTPVGVPMPLSPRGGCGNACAFAYCHTAAVCASRLPPVQHQRLPHSVAPTHLTSTCAPLCYCANKTTQRRSTFCMARLAS